MRAAVASGADAVYFGLPQFNARMRAENFTYTDLPCVVDFLHAHGVKAYVALNVLIFTSELDLACQELKRLQAAGVDAVIIQDVGLAVLARSVAPALAVHASTQMTITSPEGVAFARSLGVSQAVLARELSKRELAKFSPELMPLEIFVHGALCVAYSGQCLTSESLGQRSANRGECAQACRMPYDMVVDGKDVPLQDKKYLLSPKDLAAVEDIPKLIELGISSFKIEGRLKSPEYVAAVTKVYRQAIDRAVTGQVVEADDHDKYTLDMTFSRGFFNGWLDGVNHQELVGATYGKKRGVFLGTVRRHDPSSVTLESPPNSPGVKPGDGIVFENLEDTNDEVGGRVYATDGCRISLQHGLLTQRALRPGTRVWKTDDPALRADLRRSFAGHLPSRTGKTAINPHFSGDPGSPLLVSAAGVSVSSSVPLQAATSRPLGTAILEEVFSKLGETPFSLGELSLSFPVPVFLPKSVLTELRRSLVEELLVKGRASRSSGVSLAEALELLRVSPTTEDPSPPQLSVLVRTFDQLEVACEIGVREIIVDFEDLRRYREAVQVAKGDQRIFLATPRIQKAGEAGFFKLIENAEPYGVLLRNVGAIEYFRKTSLCLHGDFSLNVANQATAAIFFSRSLQRLTVSYDLTALQVIDLAKASDPARLEVTLHQHMPMFHMEHCAFAAFLSDGKTFLDCGRPCEKHEVKLRDRVGIEHPLKADVGCRNTLFRATPQSGAEFLNAFHQAGLFHFRVELLDENRHSARQVLQRYEALLKGELSANQLVAGLNAEARLGVTTGTLGSG